MNIYNRICAALSPTGYEISEQGSYGVDDVLPETHITYQIIDQPDTAHADNEPHGMTSLIRLVLYSKVPTIVQDADQTFRSILIPLGFMRSGGRGLPFDAETGHYGYANDYKFYEEV